jgi:hypothetical protein
MSKRLMSKRLMSKRLMSKRLMSKRLPLGNQRLPISCIYHKLTLPSKFRPELLRAKVNPCRSQGARCAPFLCFHANDNQRPPSTQQANTFSPPSLYVMMKSSVRLLSCTACCVLTPQSDQITYA